jgi:Glycosyltransferase family 92
LLDIVKLFGVRMKKKLLFLFVYFCFFSYAHAANILPHQDNIKVHKPCYIAISCVFQNEACWLKEWIEFHRLVGVEHFYLYNNLSQDGYLSVLQPYISKGIVELFEYPQEAFARKHQIFVYNHAIKLANEDQVKWLALIDADEFLNPIINNDLPSILKDFESYPGIEIQWLMYGTSKVDRLKHEELMIEKLVYRAPEKHRANKFVKHIVQPPLTSRSRSPHHCEYLYGELPYQMPLDILRINHYYFRTEDFLHEIKIPRLKERKKNGTGNVFNENSILKFRPVANKVHDRTMERFVKPLRKKVFRPLQ